MYRELFTVTHRLVQIVLVKTLYFIFIFFMAVRGGGGSGRVLENSGWFRGGQRGSRSGGDSGGFRGGFHQPEVQIRH